MPTSPPRRLRRQFTFLRQLAKEARHLQRQDLLRHANADQINAVSEVILNSLKGRVPLSPTTVRAWRPQKQTLRTLAHRKTSLKKRRDLLMNQKGAGFWRGLNNALDGCCVHRSSSS